MAASLRGGEGNSWDSGRPYVLGITDDDAMQTLREASFQHASLRSPRALDQSPEQEEEVERSSLLEQVNAFLRCL